MMAADITSSKNVILIEVTVALIVMISIQLRAKDANKTNLILVRDYEMPLIDGGDTQVVRLERVSIIGAEPRAGVYPSFHLL